MQNTAVITLMYLMFGQFLILTFGAFILWWVGDFSSTPFEERQAKDTKDQAPETKIAARDTGKPSAAVTETLPALAHEDHSIQPQATAEPIDHDGEIEPAHVHANDAEKTLLRSVG